MRNADLLDTIEVEDGTHIIWQRLWVRPYEVLCDRNNVLLPIESCNNLLHGLRQPLSHFSRQPDVTWCHDKI